MPDPHRFRKLRWLLDKRGRTVGEGVLVKCLEVMPVAVDFTAANGGDAAVSCFELHAEHNAAELCSGCVALHAAQMASATQFFAEPDQEAQDTARPSTFWKQIRGKPVVELTQRELEQVDEEGVGMLEAGMLEDARDGLRYPIAAAVLMLANGERRIFSLAIESEGHKAEEIIRKHLGECAKLQATVAALGKRLARKGETTRLELIELFPEPRDGIWSCVVTTEEPRLFTEMSEAAESEDVARKLDACRGD